MNEAACAYRIAIGTVVSVLVLVLGTTSSAKGQATTSTYWDILRNKQITKLRTIEWANRQSHVLWLKKNRWQKVLSEPWYYQELADKFLNNWRSWQQEINKLSAMFNNLSDQLKTVEWAGRRSFDKFRQMQRIDNQLKMLKTAEWATRQSLERFSQIHRFSSPMRLLKTIEWTNRQSLDRFSQMDMLRKAQAVLAKSAHLLSSQAWINQQKYYDFMRRYSDRRDRNQMDVAKWQLQSIELKMKADQAIRDIYEREMRFAAELAFRGAFGAGAFLPWEHQSRLNSFISFASDRDMSRLLDEFSETAMQVVVDSRIQMFDALDQVNAIFGGLRDIGKSWIELKQPSITHRYTSINQQIAPLQTSIQFENYRWDSLRKLGHINTRMWERFRHRNRR